MIRKLGLLSGLLAVLGVVLAPGDACLADDADQVAVYSPIRPVTDVYHGVAVTDPYRWEENADDPLTQNWTEAQNDRTRVQLDGFAGRAALKRDLTTLMSDRPAAYSNLKPAGLRVFALYTDPKLQQPQLISLDAAADPASRQVVLDPNALDAKGAVAIDWFVPSPDGKRVAVSLSRDGSEDGTLHVYDTASGREVETPIPQVQYPTAGGSLAWTPDGRGFWYTRYPGQDAPAADRHFNLQVYFHALGGDWRSDPLALGKADGLERISEIYLDAAPGQAQALASVQRGDGTDWAFYVLAPGKPAIQVAGYQDQIASAAFAPNGCLYAISLAGAPNGQVVRLDKIVPGARLAAAPVIVPETDTSLVTGGLPDGQHDLVLDAHHLYVRDTLGGPQDVRVFDLGGRPMFKLPLPEVAANDEITPLANGDVLYDVSTYLRPTYWLDWTPASGETREVKLNSWGKVSFTDMEAVRAFAVSRDGTKIPYTVIRRRGTPLNGRTPTLLYGYGGFGISQTPYVLGARQRLWFNIGGVYAIANIRGGGEYGPRWHQLGALAYKQNGFDDFAAVAQALISAGYTDHAHLALMGGSNGGLLMGAMITQHPSLARAVVSSVGIYDMLRLERDPNGAFNTAEYGSVADEAQFKTLYSYSPYQHIRPGPFPAVLLLTGAHDGRVNPMQSRKFAVALQAATTSDLPVLLRTDPDTGHGIGSPVSARVDEYADELSFLFLELGVRYPPGGRD